MRVFRLSNPQLCNFQKVTRQLSTREKKMKSSQKMILYLKAAEYLLDISVCVTNCKLLFTKMSHDIYLSGRHVKS